MPVTQRESYADVDAAYLAGERPTKAAHMFQTAPILNARECLRLIERVCKGGSRAGKVSAEGTTGGHVDLAQYRGREAAFNPTGSRYRWLMDRLAPHVAEAANHLGMDDLKPAEMARVIKYDVAGHFHWHRDSSEQSGADGIRRRMTVSLQLSPAHAYCGGDLAVVGKDRHWACSDHAQGAACLFPAHLYHRAMPVTRGRRVALVMWFD